MSYITRNANMILLFLIVLIAGSLVGATVFFQARFSSTNEEYDARVAELDSITAQVTEMQAVLEKAQLELELKASREESFTEKYAEAKGTADDLTSQNEDLEIQLADSNSQITLKNNKISTLTSQIASKDALLKSKDNTIDDLNDDKDDLDDEVDCLRTTGDAQEQTNC